MKIGKKTVKLCYILLLFCSILYSINYSLGNYSYFEDNPFQLSDNYIVLIQRNPHDINFHEIIDVALDQDVVVLSTSADGRSLGIYDPGMYYSYRAGMQMTQPGVLRYFSLDDYRNNTNVGILVDGYKAYEVELYKSKNELYGVEEIINCFERSPFSNGEIKIITNLFAMESQGGTVYLDSTNIESLRIIKEKFINNGFRSVNILQRQTYDLDMFKAVKYGLMSRYSQYMLLASFATVLVYVIISFTYLYNERTRMYIHIISGASFLTLFRNFIIKFIIPVSVICTTALGLVIINERMGLNYLSTRQFILVYVSYVGFISIVYLVNFSIHFMVVERKVDKI